MPRSRSALILLSVTVLILASSCSNRPPDVPPAPTGSANWYPDKQYTCTVVATDPNDDNVAVRVDWGDSTIGEWTDWAQSGGEMTATHVWTDTGTYQVIAQARDRKLAESDWSPALAVAVLPRPEVPAVPVGPTFCFKDSTYTFKSVTTDRFGDSVSIRFDWGSDTSDWSPFVASGESVAMSYAWSKVGFNLLKAQARDPKSHMTDWSETLTVEVIERRPPNPPAAPSGPFRGGIDSTYTFTTSAAHPQHLQVAIRFDWGDGDTSDWSAWVDENTTVADSHVWRVAETCFVKAQARDTGNALSGWSDPYRIVVRPKDTLRIWRYQIKTGAPELNYSSPAIGSDGTVYVGSQDNHLYAVNSNGTLKWSFLTGGVVRSSPAIGADGTVYVGSYDNRLYALNPDGTVKWSYATGGNISSSPSLAADGTIIFGSNDEKIYALNPDSTLKWSYATQGAVYSSPAVASDGTIYCGSNDRYFYCLNSDGTLRWRHKCDREVESSPAIAADGTVYFGADDDYVYALNPDSTLKWSVLANGQVQTSPAIAPDGTVYVGSDVHLLYALNPDGSTKWWYVTGDKVRSSPAISANGIVYFGSDDNFLYALNPDGTLFWQYEVDNDIESSPTVGPDGTIYFVSNDGYLYALKGTSTLAGSSWPKFRHDIRNNGRIGAR